jgi:hypothetical protein
MSATIACPIASPTSVRAITAYLTDIHVEETYDFFAAKSILIRALGFTAASATVSIPVLLADNPQKRVDYHLQQLTKALQEQYPEAKLLGRTRCWEAWRGCTGPGDIIATVRADGKSYPFDQS